MPGYRSRRRRGRICLAILACAVGTGLAPTAAVAGPPYETDDLEPTDVGQFEVYAFGALEEAAGDRSAAAGSDLNYGPVEYVQLTATLPLGYSSVVGTAMF